MFEPLPTSAARSGQDAFSTPLVYSTDLAYIHDAGFSDFARRAAPEIVAIFRGYGIRRGLVVDVGCGSGVLASHLIEAGYRVLGIDRSAAMIRLGRQRTRRTTFRVASLPVVRFPRCVAIVALNEIVNYMSDSPRRLDALARFVAHAYEALTPGGLLIFDFLASGERRTYSGKSRSGADWAIAASAKIDRSGRVLTRELTMFRQIAGEYRKSHETHRIRIYEADRVRDVLTAAGFIVRMRRSYGRLRLLPGDFAVIAEKRAA
jgi:SAM-dependent methyltransferase